MHAAPLPACHPVSCLSSSTCLLKYSTTCYSSSQPAPISLHRTFALTSQHGLLAAHAFTPQLKGTLQQLRVSFQHSRFRFIQHCGAAALTTVLHAQTRLAHTAGMLILGTQFHLAVPPAAPVYTSCCKNDLLACRPPLSYTVP
mmetsp:Transcript_34936/g.77685  ORF Transcript_34936/g.77685 Transcript_34936/m.77685 type:complete len:143 (-) Transcript_34936:1588-2016(-)